MGQGWFLCLLIRSQFMRGTHDDANFSRLMLITSHTLQYHDMELWPHTYTPAYGTHTLYMDVARTVLDLTNGSVKQIWIGDHLLEGVFLPLLRHFYCQQKGSFND